MPSLYRPCTRTHSLYPLEHLGTEGMISLWLTFITQCLAGVQQFAQRSCHTASAGEWNVAWARPIPVGDCGRGISGVRAGHCASFKCNGIHLHQYGGLLHRKRLVGRQSGCVCCHASRLWHLDTAHGLLAACGKLFNSCYCRFAALGEYPVRFGSVYSCLQTADWPTTPSPCPSPYLCPWLSCISFYLSFFCLSFRLCPSGMHAV